MEEWEQLARTVPGALMLVADATATELPEILDRAHARLAACVEKAHDLRIGLSAVANLFGWDHPSDALEEACRALASLRERHAAAGRVLVLHGTRRGLLGDPVWQNWEARRAAANGHAGAALHQLRSACGYARAIDGAVRIADRFDRGSRGWKAWFRMASEFASFAMWGEVAARLSVRQMRDALRLEFFDAWMILSR